MAWTLNCVRIRIFFDVHVWVILPNCLWDFLHTCTIIIPTITFLFSLKSNIVNPTLDQAPKTQYLFLNRTSYLWCPVKGAPAPYIVWRKDGVAVQNSTSITFQLKVTSENNVNYSCEVRRDGEVLRRDISLRIEGEVLLFCWSISVLYIIGLSKPVLFHLLKILTTRKKVQTTLVVGSYLTFQN